MQNKITLNESDMREFVTNVTGVIAARASLQQRLGQTYGGDRDIYAALGLAKNPTVSDLYGRWRRQGVARRVVRAMPDATWRVQPEVYDDADAQNETPFEKRWKEVVQATRLWNRVARADRLAGVGEFSVVLLGTDDVRSEVAYQTTLQKAKNLVFVQVFGRWNVTINEWVSDTTDPQYGKPLFYELKAGQPGALLQGTGLAESSVSARQSNLKVHHSRVIHVADDVEEDDLMGTPRMLPVLNDLQMLELVASGSAEMFWRGGFPGMSLEMDAQARPLTAEEKTALNETIQNYVMGLERVMRLQGIQAKPIGGMTNSGPNPGPTCDTLFQMISAGTGIPMRILTGSERGELASSQDSENWYSRVDERRANWAECEVVRPIVQRLIDCKVLPEPKGGEFTVDWAKAVAATEAERVDLGSKRTQSLSSYVGSGLMDVIPPADYFERFLAMSPEDAKTLADIAEERANAAMEREQVLMEEQAAAQAEAAAAGGEAPLDDSAGIQFNATKQTVTVDLDDSEENEDWIKAVTKAREAKGGVA